MPFIEVAAASNAAYLPHIAALMESLAVSNPPHSLRLNLLHDASIDSTEKRLLQDTANRLRMACRLIQPTAEQICALPPAHNRYPQLIWYRILLPELLPNHARVIYLDADTLVLQDLMPLWSLPLGDEYLLAAVPQHDEMSGAKRLEPFGFPAGAPYFNSGVLLMNLNAIRNDHLPRKLTNLALRHGADLRYPDQDALNLGCLGRWHALHPRWNAFASLFLTGRDAYSGLDELSFVEAIVSPSIVHFEGSIYAKPWHLRCTHPHRNLYRSYRNRSPWPLERLEGDTIKSRVLKFLPISLQLLLGNLRRCLSSRRVNRADRLPPER